jgi:3-hydroxyacyl-CoA dehydrogenase
MEYRPQQKPRFASLETVSKISNRAERIRTLCAASDQAGVFAWKHLSSVLCYAADRLTEIADDVVTVDNAMKWGYNWELGPFEIWDALGVRETVERLTQEGREVPPLVRDLLSAGKTSFYEERDGRRSFFDLARRSYTAEVEAPKVIHLPRLHKAGKVVRSNPGASLVDLGDGVACLEFHTKMNVIGGDQLGMLRESLEEVRKNFAGLVIGNQARIFPPAPISCCSRRRSRIRIGTRLT